MKKRFFLHCIVVCIVACIGGCTCTGINMSHIEFVDFEGYGDKDKDVALAKNVVSSSISHFIRKSFPTLTQEDLQNIRYGYFIRAEDDVVQFKIDLQTNNRAISKKKNQIIKVLGNRLKKMAEIQMEKKNEIEKAQEKAEAWLVAIDQKEFGIAWNQITDFMKSNVSYEMFSTGMNKNQTNAGDFVSRELLVGYYFVDEPDYKYYQNEPGSPAGEFAVFLYKTDYSQIHGISQSVVVWKSPEGGFVVSGMEFGKKR